MQAILDRAVILPHKEGRSSFLKKRSKKLLSVKGGTRLAHWHRLSDAMSKSFLLLFFKKEDLPSESAIG
jgi:hypothetical protein